MDPSMDSMDGYMLVHGIQWKDANAVSINTPLVFHFEFPWDSYEFL